MALTLSEHMQNGAGHDLAFEGRAAFLLDVESLHPENKALTRLPQLAAMRYRVPVVEDSITAQAPGLIDR